jgi:hypothetical protein
VASRAADRAERRAIVTTTAKSFSKDARAWMSVRVRVFNDGRWATSTPRFSTTKKCAAYASNG